MIKTAQGNKKVKFIAAGIIVTIFSFLTYAGPRSPRCVATGGHPGLRFLFSHGSTELAEVRGHRELWAWFDHPPQKASPAFDTQPLSHCKIVRAPVRTGARAGIHCESRKTKVTAYCPCGRCCGRFADGVTASGHKIKAGDRLCAADKQVPFGTAVIVPGYNNSMPALVLDRGGAIRGDRLDVLFDTHAEAKEWGVKTLNCYFARDRLRKDSHVRMAAAGGQGCYSKPPAALSILINGNW
ncbi:MAG: hypothetical protein DRP65_00520 [Planctomycetota bacterium]|nr:MAG: hypothetical protein DRP65_00520 [Planctomycetota bacterium]